MRWSHERGMTVRRTGSGPCIVWIHGLGESSVSFEATVAALPDYSHVLVDLPGCGRSPWPAAAPSIDGVADTLAELVRCEPPSVLIGHSLGGVMATLVAERAPVRGLIDVDGNITRGDCNFSAAAAAYTLDEFVARGFAALRDTIYVDGLTRPELRLYHAALSFASPYVFHRHACELVELSATNTLAPRLAALRVPVLFVAGAPRGICEPSHRMLADHGVPVTSIEPAGHWVYVDQPAAFTASVRAFLAQL